MTQARHRHPRHGQRQIGAALIDDEHVQSAGLKVRRQLQDVVAQIVARRRFYGGLVAGPSPAGNRKGSCEAAMPVQGVRSGRGGSTT